MLDPRLLRERPEVVEAAAQARGAAVPLTEFRDADGRRRALLREAEDRKAQRNRLSETIAAAKRRGEDVAPAVEEARRLGDTIREADARLRELEAELLALVLRFPNVPHPSVPVGVSAEDNVEVRRWGTPRAFAFEPRPHWEIGDVLGILDFERASKIAKSRFAVLWGAGARLERALTQLMLDLHTKAHGYREVWVPHLVNAQAMTGAGQLPKFEEELFKTVEPEAGRPLYLIPTAEVPLTTLHGGEILPAESLPRKYTAFTPCYRREAGSYGADTRGMIRQHQFDKVELVKLTTPESSYDELEAMVRDAETVLQRLELPYRVMLLATGDLSFASAKTYDLEVWLPGQNAYREISSCSNYEAFQARRMQARFRNEKGKTELVHTLNGSGLAVGRTLVAILENFQTADGSVSVPTALHAYMGGIEKLARS